MGEGAHILSKPSKGFSPEVCDRAVRMVGERKIDEGCQQRKHPTTKLG